MFFRQKVCSCPHPTEIFFASPGKKSADAHVTDPHHKGSGKLYGCHLFQSERKLFLGGREVTLAQQYMAVAVCSIPLFLLAGAGKNHSMTSHDEVLNTF
jgi:hypothetical protein